MGVAKILIVDDEESILAVMKSGLEKHDRRYTIYTATNGVDALKLMQKQRFRLVVTDYRMERMNGLELLKAIRVLQPEARVILVTAYGSDVIETEAQRLQAYRYLVKPVNLNVLRRIVDEAMGDLAINQPGILILSDERYLRVVELLAQLRADAGAQSVFLTDSDGRAIAQTGATFDVPLEHVSALMGGALATLIEAGRLIDGGLDSTNLAYREGKGECIYATNIGKGLLLVLVVARVAFGSRVGLVWYAVQKETAKLREALGGGDVVSVGGLLEGTTEQDFDQELNTLLKTDPDLGRGIAREARAGPATVGRTGSTGSSETSSGVLTFEEAVRAGLVPKDLSAARMATQPSGGSTKDAGAGRGQA